MTLKNDIKRTVSALLAVLFLFSFSSPTTGSDEPEEQAFLTLVNAMRSDPASFIPKIDEYANDWRSFVPNKKKFERAVAEAKKALKNTKPLPPFQLDTHLVKAAYDHALDGRRMAVLGHIGSDKSNPYTRVQRYVKYETVSEVITYGQAGAADMLAAFLVDHDTPGRGHRKTILSTNLNSIGIAIDSHPKFRTQCVAVFANVPK